MLSRRDFGFKAVVGGVCGLFVGRQASASEEAPRVRSVKVRGFRVDIVRVKASEVLEEGDRSRVIFYRDRFLETCLMCKVGPHRTVADYLKAYECDIDRTAQMRQEGVGVRVSWCVIVECPEKGLIGCWMASVPRPEYLLLPGIKLDRTM
jgi:hypothetical protein